MTREQWNALAKRCEISTGHDREIDGLLCASVRHAPLRYSYADPVEWRPDSDGGVNVHAGPHLMRVERILSPVYTASLDAITALIDKELSGQHLISGHETVKPWRGKFLCFITPPDPTCPNRSGYGATEPLARCAAFCRAMAERTEA